MKSFPSFAFFALVFIAAPVLAEQPVALEMDKAWLTAPSFREAPDLKGADVKAIYFDGLPWQGKTTRVFAWVGLPKPNPHSPRPRFRAWC